MDTASKASGQARPLSQDELRRLDAYWRAANYLSVGQIYLLDNPLLRERIRASILRSWIGAGRVGCWAASSIPVEILMRWLHCYATRPLRHWSSICPCHHRDETGTFCSTPRSRPRRTVDEFSFTQVIVPFDRYRVEGHALIVLHAADGSDVGNSEQLL